MRRGQTNLGFVITVVLFVGGLTLFASLGGPSLFPKEFSSGSVTPGLRRGDVLKIKSGCPCSGSCGTTEVVDLLVSYCRYPLYEEVSKGAFLTNGTETYADDYPVSLYFKPVSAPPVKEVSSECGLWLDGGDPDTKNDTYVYGCMDNRVTFVENYTAPCEGSILKNNHYGCTNESQRYVTDDMIVQADFYAGPSYMPSTKVYLNVHPQDVVREVKPKPPIQPPRCNPIPTSLPGVGGALGCISSYAGYVTSVLGMLPTQGPLGWVLFIPIVVGTLYVLVDIASKLIPG